MKKLKVPSSTRLLSFIKKNFAFSTKDLRWSIEHGRCFVNGRVERFGSSHLQKGDEVVIWPTKRPFLKKEQMRVLYEDDALLIYDKPPYIASSDLAKILGVHLVHRLDRDTTGVIIFAKKNPAPFEELFRKRKVEKTYHALVKGTLKKRGTFSAKIGKIGRREGAVIWGISPNGIWSQTDWECEQLGINAALVRCHPLTGRTHQIRVHMKAMGHPILGDCEYGNRKGISGLFRPLLHASGLSFDTICVIAPFPTDFVRWKEQLF